MTFDELFKYFESTDDSDLAKKIGVSKVSVHKWRHEGIPETRQAIIQVQTKGKLKADLQQIKTA